MMPFKYDMQTDDQQISNDDKVFVLLYIIFMVLSLVFIAVTIYIIVEDLYHCSCS